MTIHYDIDVKTRFIVLYQDAQMKPTRMSKLIGVPLRTVQDWIFKIENDIDILEHHSKNICKKITEDTRMDIINEATQSPKRVSTRRLGAKHTVSHTMVRTMLIEEGFEFKKPEKKFTLTKDEMDNRVDYCRNMLKYRGRKLKQCFFSDEMGVRLSELHKARKMWISPQQQVQTDVIGQDVKVNCWGAISWNGATSLHIFFDNLNKRLYQTIVENHKEEMENLYEGQDFCFQQDNHPTHNNLDVFDDDENIEIIDFPTYSPDLNPIENLWATLKYRVACDAPLTRDELVESLERNWEEITEIENLRPYLETLTGRYEQCIEEQGNRLPH